MIVEFQRTVTPYVKGDIANIREDAAKGLVDKGAAKYVTRDAQAQRTEQRQAGRSNG